MTPILFRSSRRGGDVMDDDRFETSAKKAFSELLGEAKQALANKKLPAAEREDIGCGQWNLEVGFREAAAILNKIRSDGRDSVAEHGFANLRMIMAGAFLIGRCATTTAGLKSLLESAKASKAGEESGRARRVKAEELWHGHALELAIELRKQNPHFSQDNVCADISAGWKLEFGPPGLSTLKQFVSDAEHDGRLLKRKPRPRKS